MHIYTQEVSLLQKFILYVPERPNHVYANMHQHVQNNSTNTVFQQQKCQQQQMLSFMTGYSMCLS